MRKLLLLTISVALVSNRAEAESSSETIEEIGDVIQFIIPITAAVVPTVRGDWDGLAQFGVSFGSTVGTVGLLKLAYDKRRPNEANKLSYPSGHTAASFSGASFLGSRYGPAWGIPAYTAALFVGYSRIQADQHYGDDVLAGASIAMLYNWAFVKNYDERLFFKVNREQQGYAFGWEWQHDREDVYFAATPTDFEPSWKYDVEFSFTWLDHVTFEAPSDTGTPIDATTGTFGAVDEPVPSTRGTFFWFFREQQEFALVINPFEERDVGTFNQDVDFGGVTIPAGGARVAYLNYEFRLRYRYEFFPESRWILKVGAALSLQWIDIIVLADTGEEGQADDLVILPLVGVLAGYEFSEKWRLLAEADGMYLDSDSLVDAAIWVEWQFGKQWDLKLGYRLIFRDVDTSALKTTLDQQRLFFGFGFQW
ncbi:MAG: phosphatase PAP2 family protein [Planctomycetota bacterium]